MKTTEKKWIPIYLLFTFLILIAIAIYTAFNFRSITHKTDTLNVGIASWPGFASAMVGMEKGFFSGIRINNHILDDASARHAAFQNGSIDIMISSIDVFAQEAAQGLPGKVILVTDESWGGDGIVVKPEITSIADLKGKKVVFARATPSHYLLLRVLEKAGLSISDIQPIQVDDPGRAGDAFLSGTVDSAVTFEPFLSNVAQSGKGKILLTTKDYPDIVVDVLVASDKLSGNQELLRRFFDGWLKSVDYIKQHPDESSQIIAKGLNTPTKDIQDMMSGLRFADRERNSYFFNKVGLTNMYMANLLNAAGSYWKVSGVISAPADGTSRVSDFSKLYFAQ